MGQKKVCRSTQMLGYVSARILSKTAPNRKDVIWAFPVSPTLFSLRIWNGSEWVPLGTGASSSGTYDTELDPNIAMVEDVGGLAAGTLVSELVGMSFISLWDMLLFPNQPAVYEDPFALISGSNPKLLKVGTAYDITIDCSFTQNDAGAQTAFRLYKEGVQISVVDPHTDLGVVLAAPGIITYEGQYDYAQGPVLNDAYGQPDPAGQIAAGTIATPEVNYEWIYPIFLGSDSDGESIDFDAGSEILQKINGDLTVTMPNNGPGFYYLAVPAGTTDFTSWFVSSINQGNIGPGNTWKSPVNVLISSGGFVDVPYDLYVTDFITQFVAPITFEV